VGADLRTDYTYAGNALSQNAGQFNRAVTCGACHSGGGGKRAETFLRLEPVPDVASIVVQTSVYPAVAGQELYGLLEALPGQGYVKAGYFRLASGLQNTYDNPFQHGSTYLQSPAPAYQGNVGLETVRAAGVEVGFEPGPFSLSFSMTNPKDADKQSRDSRAQLSGYAVGRLGVAGLNLAWDPISATSTRALTGTYLGTSLGRITALVEVDQVEVSDVKGTSLSSEQAALAEADLLIAKGHNLRFIYEMRDPNTKQAKDVRDRTSVIYEPFLTPYLQVRGGYRVLAGPIQYDKTKVDENNGEQVFAEVHFVF